MSEKIYIDFTGDKNTTWFMVTTIPGLEDIVLMEAYEKLNVLEANLRFGNIGGRVLIEVSRNEAHKIFSLRSIEHVISLIKAFNVEAGLNGLNQIYDEVYKCDIPLGETFRVTCERVGEHEFTSIDVQRVAGQALVDKYGRKVNLKEPETIVRVDIAHNLCIVGMQETKTSLRIRYPRIFQHYSALNPVIAYAMLRIANVKSGDNVLDAFCGSGTIIIEAAQIWENLNLLGIDISPKSIEGAWKNSEAAGVKDKVKFIVGDATRLEKYLPKDWKVDKAVSNLPFGIRSGRMKAIPRLYAGFLKSLKPFLEDCSKICLLTIHKELLEKISGELGYRILESRWILHGGLHSCIILLNPIACCHS